MYSKKKYFYSDDKSFQYVIALDQVCKIWFIMVVQTKNNQTKNVWFFAAGTKGPIQPKI